MAVVYVAAGVFALTQHEQHDALLARLMDILNTSRHQVPDLLQPYIPEDLQALVTNLAADSYLGRLAVCRVHEGTIRKGQQAAWCRADGSMQQVKIAELFVTRELDRVPVDEAGPGDIRGAVPHCRR